MTTTLETAPLAAFHTPDEGKYEELFLLCDDGDTLYLDDETKIFATKRIL